MDAAEDFEEFVTVVESGSMTAAAEVMGLPRPTLSRRLGRLESRLGVRLLHRTTRSLKMTPEGKQLYARARLIVAAAKEAEAEIRRLDGVPRGLLRVSVPAGVPSSQFSEWMVEFLSTYSEVRVELVGTSVHVDLVADGFDVALRAGPLADPSLVARTVMHNCLIAVASPRYLELRGTPSEPAELARHNCIVGFKFGSTPEREWPLEEGGSAEVNGNFMTNQMDLRLEAAKRDLGIALVLEGMAADSLRTGALVQVLAGQLGRRYSVSLVYPSREFQDPKVRAFVDFMTQRIERRKLSFPRS